MSTRIVIDITTDPIINALSRMASALGEEGLKKPLIQIGEYLADSTRKRFNTGTSPDGMPWARNTKTTYERYLASPDRGKNTLQGNTPNKGRINKRGAGQAASKKPLIDTGTLAESITWQLLPHGVMIGSDRKYASTQQFGASKGQFGHDKFGRPIPWGNIPARPFLGLSAQDETEVMDIIRRHVMGVMG